MKEEVWKVIPYYTKYEVSNKGRVRNRETKHILSAKPTKSHKHPQVFLQLECKYWAEKHQMTLSHLVYDAFLLKDGETTSYRLGVRIGHKDGNILNNSADNLYRVLKKKS